MWDEEHDLVVVGGGGAGMTAALRARSLGMRVAVVESQATLGGTYAYSSGLVWAPANRFMRAAGLSDSITEALDHIRLLSGGRHDDEFARTCLENVDRVLGFLDQQGIPFEWLPTYPDYYAERPGGKHGGRYLAPPVFRASEHLTPEQAAVVSDSPYYGGLPVSWSEIQQWGGFGSIGRWPFAELAERMQRGERGFGAATAGFMAAALFRSGASVRPGTRVTGLVLEGGRVQGVTCQSGDAVRRLRGRCGIILACGGYDWNARLKQALDRLPETVPMGSPGVDGGPILMALELGAAYEALGQLLVPCYHIPGELQDNGRELWRPLAREAGFPGCILVNSAGQRFADEAFYRDVGHAMAHFSVATQSYPNLAAWLVMDRQWKDSYPLGSVMPGEVPGWMVRAPDADSLAQALGIAAGGLATAIERFNGFAAEGVDRDFNRGGYAFSRNNGDPQIGPNPSLRALRPPLYAVPVRLGTTGTNSGLRVTPHGEVVALSDQVIPNLYAVGNAGASLLEGLWLNSGTSNTRGITVGCLAVERAYQNGR